MAGRIACDRVTPPRSTAFVWAWFACWLLVGAGYAFALLSLLTIGLLVLVVAVAGTVLLLIRPSARRGVPGLIAGAGLPALYVAFLNRSGPGEVCTSTGTGQACTDQWSPWGWLVGGLVLLLLGFATFIWVTARRRRDPAVRREG